MAEGTKRKGIRGRARPTEKARQRTPPTWENKKERISGNNEGRRAEVIAAHNRGDEMQS